MKSDERLNLTASNSNFYGTVGTQKPLNATRGGKKHFIKVKQHTAIYIARLNYSGSASFCLYTFLATTCENFYIYYLQLKLHQQYKKKASRCRFKNTGIFFLGINLFSCELISVNTICKY